MTRDDRGGGLEACIEHIVTGREVAVTSRRPEVILLGVAASAARGPYVDDYSRAKPSKAPDQG